MKKHVWLNKEATDTVTGVSGVITAHVEYITGCDQFTLQQKAQPDGTFLEARWFDEDRLKLKNKISTKRTPKKKQHKWIGKQAIDQITDICGLIIARVEYTTGSVQFLIQPKARDNNKIEASWFDEQRLKVKRAPKIILDNKNAGVCDVAPIK